MASAFTDFEFKIATEIALRAIGGAFDRGGRLAKDLREYWTQHKGRDASTYANYLVRKGVQANSVRNLIYDKQGASLYDIYVPTTIKNEDVTGDQLIAMLCEPVDTPKQRESRAIAIVGQAGTGKSLFMKHAFFRVQQVASNRIPVLIEVRTFNRVRLGSLERRICEELSFYGSVSLEQTTNGLRSGLFVILLDGMDELKAAIQRHYEAELDKLLNVFPLCPVLISSRPNPRMRSWAVDIRPIAPLDLDAARALVAPLPFDAMVKKEFGELLNGSLFRTHYEFASVPLLCTIMLLTFSSSGHIANSGHEFFEDAFGALWSKHDGFIPNFERHRYTGLQKSEFLRLLAAFAVSSYSEGDYNMREAQFRRHFRHATRLSGVNCKENDFLQDLTLSTSLAIQDEPYVRFCHLSFHEYFAAVFVCDADEWVAEIIEDLSDRLETSNVLPLVLSMNEEKIEKYWVVPKARAIADAIEAVGGDMGRYAHMAVGESGHTTSDIPNAMSKLRILYSFEPTTEALRGAFDAARGMKIGIGRLTRGSASRIGIFEQDQRNFLELRTRLADRYEKRSLALHELLRRVPKLDANR